MRIITATNRDLAEMVAQGKFREDLYFRLSVFHIHVPPLRERRQDLPALLKFMLQRNTRHMSDRQEITFDPGVETLLLNYEWPGNVREMENVIDRAIILADGNRITMADLPTQITKVDQSAALLGDNLQTSGTLREQMRRYEVALILRTIEETGGDRRAAAQKLNIGLSSLYRKLEELGGQPLPEEDHAGKEARQE